MRGKVLPLALALILLLCSVLGCAHNEDYANFSSEDLLSRLVNVQFTESPVVSNELEAACIAAARERREDTEYVIQVCFWDAVGLGLFPSDLYDVLIDALQAPEGLKDVLAYEALAAAMYYQRLTQRKEKAGVLRDAAQWLIERNEDNAFYCLLMLDVVAANGPSDTDTDTDMAGLQLENFLRAERFDVPLPPPVTKWDELIDERYQGIYGMWLSTPGQFPSAILRWARKTPSDEKHQTIIRFCKKLLEVEPPINYHYELCTLLAKELLGEINQDAKRELEVIWSSYIAHPDSYNGIIPVSEFPDMWEGRIPVSELRAKVAAVISKLDMLIATSKE